MRSHLFVGSVLVCALQIQAFPVQLQSAESDLSALPHLIPLNAEMNHILYRRGKESGGPASAAAAAAPAFVTYASELKRLGKQAKKEQTKQENVEKTIAIQAALDKLVAQQMISLEKLRARTAETERAAAIVAKADEVEVLEAALVQTQLDIVAFDAAERQEQAKSAAFGITFEQEMSLVIPRGKERMAELKQGFKNSINGVLAKYLKEFEGVTKYNSTLTDLDMGKHETPELKVVITYAGALLPAKVAKKVEAHPAYIAAIKRFRPMRYEIAQERHLWMKKILAFKLAIDQSVLDKQERKSGRQTLQEKLEGVTNSRTAAVTELAAME